MSRRESLRLEREARAHVRAVRWNRCFNAFMLVGIPITLLLNVAAFV